MIGMMNWTPPAGGVRQKSVVLETRALLHLRVAWASVARGPRTPETLVRRRVLTAAKWLRKAGVTRLVDSEQDDYYVLDLWYAKGWEDGVWVRGLMEAPEPDQTIQNLLSLAGVVIPAFMFLPTKSSVSLTILQDSRMSSISCGLLI